LSLHLPWNMLVFAINLIQHESLMMWVMIRVEVSVNGWALMKQSGWYKMPRIDHVGHKVPEQDETVTSPPACQIISLSLLSLSPLLTPLEHHWIMHRFFGSSKNTPKPTLTDAITAVSRGAWNQMDPRMERKRHVDRAANYPCHSKSARIPHLSTCPMEAKSGALNPSHR
jgi:hypothetical protein